jgi:hypothetical protein
MKSGLLHLSTIMLLFAVPRIAGAEITFICQAEGSSANPPVIHAGDTVTVEATLATSDPDENTEHGEFLVVTSSGGFRAVLSTYAKPQSFTFQATIDGETISGALAGFDEDESCVLTIVNVTHILAARRCSMSCSFSSGSISCRRGSSASCNCDSTGCFSGACVPKDLAD